jgi:hypothetical protein
VRRLEPHSGVAAFPEASPESAVVQDRWESLLGKAPRLRPWLSQMLQRRRTVLAERLGSGAGEEIDRLLWHELGRWLRDFEALPNYAVSAIALDLSDEPAPRAADRPRQPEPAAGPGDRAEARSPESAACELEALVADPAFALAFHCIEARVRPRLEPATKDRPSLARIPEAAWFGLLHASIPAEPKLTARVAISLVLRMRSQGWSAQPAAARKAALRLFVGCSGLRPPPVAGKARSSDAGPLDARSGTDSLRAALPKDWDLPAQAVPDFVAAANLARKGLSEANALCARLVSRIGATCRRTGKARPGGLGLLQEDGAGTASDAEAREVVETARNYVEMAGFGPLLEILREAP